LMFASNSFEKSLLCTVFWKNEEVALLVWREGVGLGDEAMQAGRVGLAWRGVEGAVGRAPGVAAGDALACAPLSSVLRSPRAPGVAAVLSTARGPDLVDPRSNPTTHDSHSPSSIPQFILSPPPPEYLYLVLVLNQVALPEEALFILRSGGGPRGSTGAPHAHGCARTCPAARRRHRLALPFCSRARVALATSRPCAWRPHNPSSQPRHSAFPTSPPMPLPICSCVQPPFFPSTHTQTYTQTPSQTHNPLPAGTRSFTASRAPAARTSSCCPPRTPP
jgi:hypothetical protein